MYLAGWLWRSRLLADTTKIQNGRPQLGSKGGGVNIDKKWAVFHLNSCNVGLSFKMYRLISLDFTQSPYCRAIIDNLPI